MTQAYLLYAQVAEKKQDFAAAEAWLQRIDNVEEIFSAQSRRASLMARQGKVEQARALLRNLPGRSADDRRMKLLAEVQLLRDLKMFQEAYKVQTELVAMAPTDPELVYDQAMLAEKQASQTRWSGCFARSSRKSPTTTTPTTRWGISLRSVDSASPRPSSSF